MDKVYLTGSKFAAGLRYVEWKHGALTKTSGPHWSQWTLNGQVVANSYCSPYPGPEYGSSSWILREFVVGAEIVVTHSRGITETEAHVLNERLDYIRASRIMPASKHCQLIPEVEAAFDHILKSGQIPSYRLGCGSFQIYWSECQFIR